MKTLLSIVTAALGISTPAMASDQGDATGSSSRVSCQWARRADRSSCDRGRTRKLRADWPRWPSLGNLDSNAPAAICHRALRGLLAAASACSLFVAVNGAAVPAKHALDETAHTAAAVIAVDEHWLRAEEGGDTAWLDAMLLPDFRTIGHDGKVVTKSMLLKSATKNRGSDKMRERVDAWLKTHPSRKSVVMHGDVAVLSFVNPQTGHIWSSDIFVYENGHWHALYSQQSASKS